MILLSPHFTLQEMTRSAIAIRHDIDNTPDQRVLENLKVLAEGLERVRTILNRSMHISSGYRCLALNTILGGSKNSKHMLGLAADFEAPSYGTPRSVFDRLRAEKSIIKYDQLLLEAPPDGWVHLGFAESASVPRGDTLIVHFSSDGVRYEHA